MHCGGHAIELRGATGVTKRALRDYRSGCAKWSSALTPTNRLILVDREGWAPRSNSYAGTLRPPSSLAMVETADLYPALGPAELDRMHAFTLQLAGVSSRSPINSPFADRNPVDLSAQHRRGWLQASKVRGRIHRRSSRPRSLVDGCRLRCSGSVLENAR